MAPEKRNSNCIDVNANPKMFKVKKPSVFTNSAPTSDAPKLTTPKIAPYKLKNIVFPF